MVAELPVVQRIERLEPSLRHLVEKVILEFGGILPRPLFDRMESELPGWDATSWSKALGESLVGTWSVSLRDESLGIAGRLVGWNLKLNSQGAVEDF